MLNKKSSILLAALIISELFIVSCQKSQVTTGKITLRFSGPGFPLYDKLRSQQGKNFEKIFPGVETKFEPVSGQGFLDKMLTQMASDTAPDLIWMGAAEMPMLVSKGAVLCLDEFIEKDRDFNIKDIHSNLIEDYSCDGKVYALPGNCSPYIMFYNKEMFDAAGIKYPDESWDWNTFLDACKKLTLKDPNGVTKQFGAAMDYKDGITYWIMFMKQNGGDLFNRDKTKCVIDSPESIGSIRFLYELFSKYHVIPNPMELKEQGGYQLFMGRRAAMFFGSRWYVFTFRRNKELKWGMAMVPKGKVRAVELASHGWLIWSKTKYPRETWELLKYITSPEGQQYLIDIGDAIPIRKSMFKSFLKDNSYPGENNEALVKSVEYSYPAKTYIHPSIPVRMYADEIIVRELDNLLIGKYDVETTAKRISGRMNKLLAEQNKK